MKSRDVIFIFVILALICGPAFLWIAQRAHLEVPQALTAAPAQYLSGGTEQADVRSAFSVSGFVSGELQHAVEAEVGNHIPAKAIALEQNAALQRAAIRASNLLRAWPCYPTYYGSTRIRLAGDMLSYLPERKSDEVETRWVEFAEGLARVAASYPEKRFVVYVVGAYGEPAYDPAYVLVHDALQPDDCLRCLQSGIGGGSSNLTILTKSYEDAESYYDDFFRTDHHWNIVGALVAYGQIVDELDLPKVDAGQMVPIPNYRYTGATARWGLDLLSESVFDCENRFSNLTFIQSDGSRVSGDDHSAFWDAEPLRKPYAFYDAYYDSFGAESTIIGGVGDRRALLVSNSYRGALQRPLASSYAQLTVNSQLAGSMPETDTLRAQIERSQADDIIIVGNPGALNAPRGYWD